MLHLFKYKYFSRTVEWYKMLTNKAMLHQQIFKKLSLIFLFFFDFQKGQMFHEECGKKLKRNAYITFFKKHFIDLTAVVVIDHSFSKTNDICQWRIQDFAAEGYQPYYFSKIVPKTRKLHVNENI